MFIYLHLISGTGLGTRNANTGENVLSASLYTLTPSDVHGEDTTMRWVRRIWYDWDWGVLTNMWVLFFVGLYTPCLCSWIRWKGGFLPPTFSASEEGFYPSLAHLRAWAFLTEHILMTSVIYLLWCLGVLYFFLRCVMVCVVCAIFAHPINSPCRFNYWRVYLCHVFVSPVCLFALRFKSLPYIILYAT